MYYGYHYQDGATSVKSLKFDLTLMGLVLGFGSHNSIVGGRLETIFALSISKDYPPFIPQSCLMQEENDLSFNALTPDRYGAYYLELAGGDDTNFRVDLPRQQPNLSFANLEEEVRALDKLEEPLPHFLWEQPKFVFGPFTGGPLNQPFFKYLHKTQKKIQTILERPDFLECVLKKINGERPVIRVGKTAPNALSTPGKCTTDMWKEILRHAANQFEDKEKKQALIEAFCHPIDSFRKAPIMMGASTAALEGLNLARCKIAKADTLFEMLSQDSSLNLETAVGDGKVMQDFESEALSIGGAHSQMGKGPPIGRASGSKDCVNLPSPTAISRLKEIVSKRLYFKTDLPGSGRELKGEDSVRIGYVIEDQEENVLFANYDSWIKLSQVIPGLAHGIQGMHVQEKRTLFIHPTLGYGVLTTLPPGSALVVKVHLLDIDSQVSGTLPPLIPLDLSWVQESCLYEDLEESLKQQPYFIGSFYREMFDKRKQLDSSSCLGIDELELTTFLESCFK